MEAAYKDHSGPEEHFQIEWGETFVVVVFKKKMIRRMNLMYLPKVSKD